MSRSLLACLAACVVCSLVILASRAGSQEPARANRSTEVGRYQLVAGDVEVSAAVGSMQQQGTMYLIDTVTGECWIDRSQGAFEPVRRAR
jgi:hypothetical protein